VSRHTNDEITEQVSDMFVMFQDSNYYHPVHSFHAPVWLYAELCHACCPSSEQFGSVEKVCESEHPQAHLSLYSFLCWNFGSYHTLLPNRTGSFVNNNEKKLTVHT